MREAYRESVQEIDTLLIEMTRLVGRAMSRATQALLDADLDAAEQVISEDVRLDEINTQIDERATQIVALQQPVAGELRRLLSALRIASSLERMGDLATHLAKTTRLRYPNTVVPVELRGVISDMGAVAQRIVHQTGAAMASQFLATDFLFYRYFEAMARGRGATEATFPPRWRLPLAPHRRRPRRRGGRCLRAEAWG